MKKAIAILFFISFLLPSEITLGTVKYYEYNSMLETIIESKTKIAYDTKDKIVYIVLSDILGTSFVGTKENYLIISNINKYLEWNTKAIQKGVKIEKTISSIKMNMYWPLGDTYYNAVCNVEFRFLSQNNNIHMLCLIFPKVVSAKNKYMSHKAETMYFTKSQAMALKNIISIKNINKMLLENSKNSKIQEDFK
jgi:hypothetical protein